MIVHSLVVIYDEFCCNLDCFQSRAFTNKIILNLAAQKLEVICALIVKNRCTTIWMYVKQRN